MEKNRGSSRIDRAKTPLQNIIMKREFIYEMAGKAGAATEEQQRTITRTEADAPAGAGGGDARHSPPPNAKPFHRGLGRVNTGGWASALRCLLVAALLGLGAIAVRVQAQSLPRSLGFALKSIRIVDEDDDGDNDEPYLITIQFRALMRYDASASRFLVDERFLTVSTLMNGQNDLDHAGDDWADEVNTYDFSTRYGISSRLYEPGWVSGAVVIHMEEDFSPASVVRNMGNIIRDHLTDRLRSLIVTGMDGPGITATTARGLVAAMAVHLGSANIAGLIDGATDSDDFGGVGLIVITGTGGSAFAFTGSPPTTSAIASARIVSVAGASNFSLGFPSGRRSGGEIFTGAHAVNGSFTEWSRTFMTNIVDAAVMPDGSATVAGTAVLVSGDGRIWTTVDGISRNWLPGPSSTVRFTRVAVAPDTTIWAVDSTGAVWTSNSSRVWRAVASISGVADLAVGPLDGRVWVARTDGSIRFSNDRGGTWIPTRFSGFSRISVARDGTAWGVGGNGTLWALTATGGATLIQRSTAGRADRVGGALGLQDVGVAPDGTVWTSGWDGTAWSLKKLSHIALGSTPMSQLEAGGFASVAADPFDGTLWAVGAAPSGSLWTFDAFLPTVADLAR